MKSPPKPKRALKRTTVYIKIDAQYYRNKCIILIKANGKLIFWNFAKRETLKSYVKSFKELKNLNYKVIGVTSDWHGSIISAVKQSFKGIPHQRCLVHTQRRCQSLITRKPKTKQGKQLLEIVRLLNKVTNHYEKNIWIKWLNRWEERNIDFIKQKTHGFKEDGSKTWWYTHKNLRGAFRTLKSSQNNLFLYLEYEDMDKDTNGIESEFSHLKQKVNMHRGLRIKQKLAVIAWYISLVNFRRKK